MKKRVTHYSHWQEVRRGVIRMAGAVIHTSDFVSACGGFVSTGERMTDTEDRVTCKRCLRHIEVLNGGPPDPIYDDGEDDE